MFNIVIATSLKSAHELFKVGIELKDFFITSPDNLFFTALYEDIFSSFSICFLVSANKSLTIIKGNISLQKSLIS